MLLVIALRRKVLIENTLDPSPLSPLFSQTLINKYMQLPPHFLTTQIHKNKKIFRVMVNHKVDISVIIIINKFYIIEFNIHKQLGI